MAKATANYMNSILIRSEAAIDGYSEGIALDVNGFVSEGSGENIFLVRDGKILTPPLGNSILSGITRDTIMTLARDLGFEVRETQIPREALYIADEVFFTGTAAEVSPIRSIDRIKIDRDFVRGLPDSRADRAIVSAVLSFASALDMEVVAEGVETQQHVDALRDLGCEYVQGFFFHLPMEAARISALLD